MGQLGGPAAPAAFPGMPEDYRDLEYEIRTARLWSISHQTIHGCPSGGDGCPVRSVIAEALRKLIAMRVIDRDPS